MSLLIPSFKEKQSTDPGSMAPQKRWSILSRDVGQSIRRGNVAYDEASTS